MVIITTLYLVLVWLLFFKFKWLPWNKLTQALCLIVGVVILSGFLVGLQGLTPASTHAVIGSSAPSSSFDVWGILVLEFLLVGLW